MKWLATINLVDKERYLISIYSGWLNLSQWLVDATNPLQWAFYIDKKYDKHSFWQIMIILLITILKITDN